MSTAVTFNFGEFHAGRRLLSALKGVVVALTADGAAPRDVMVQDVVSRDGDGLLSLAVVPWSDELAGPAPGPREVVPWDDIAAIHIY